MIKLPPTDYNPLTKKFISTTEVRKKFGIKEAWLPDSEYVGGHPPFSLGDEEVNRAARLYQFALANNFGFITNLPGILPFPKSYFHSLATLSSATMITHGIIIKLETGWLEIGELRLEDAASYESQSSRFAYAKITLNQQLPNITIDSLNTGLPTTRHGKNTYRTESNEFHRHFKLYLDSSHAQAGLKILSPDVMATLIDSFNQFDIEMRDYTISLITYGHDLTDPATLKYFIETISRLTNELSYQVRSPAKSDVIPQDIESYKAFYGYTRQAEEAINSKARKETLRVFLISLGIVLFLFIVAFLAALQ